MYSPKYNLDVNAAIDEKRAANIVTNDANDKFPSVLLNLLISAGSAFSKRSFQHSQIINGDHRENERGDIKQNIHTRTHCCRR